MFPISAHPSVFDAHSLDFSVELQRVLQTFSSDARILATTKRHIQISHHPAINPHRPHLEVTERERERERERVSECERERETTTTAN